MGCSNEWKDGESPSLIKHAIVTRCKSEKHVPIVAVFAEGRFPDVPVKASDDRLRIPGAQTPGRGEEVAKSSAFRSPQPGE